MRSITQLGLIKFVLSMLRSEHIAQLSWGCCLHRQEKKDPFALFLISLDVFLHDSIAFLCLFKLLKIIISMINISIYVLSKG